MQKQQKIYGHCKEPIGCRTGRGLCRECWNNKEIRAKYNVIAQFGGNTRPKEIKP